LYSKLERDDDAIALYEELLDFEQEKPEIYLYLALVYLRKKEYNAAEEVFTDALSRFPENDDLNFNLAILYEKTGRFDDMVQYLKKVIEINPEHADALNYLGYSYVDKGIHLDEAYILIKKALELKPNNGYIIDSLGWLYFKLGNYDEALEKLLKAAELTKDDPVILEHIGDVYYSMGVAEKAREYWEKALAIPEKEEGVLERVEKKIQDLQ
jgi:tetratricopeptide (TPR) repeat protein